MPGWRITHSSDNTKKDTLQRESNKWPWKNQQDEATK